SGGDDSSAAGDTGFARGGANGGEGGATGGEDAGGGGAAGDGTTGGAGSGGATGGADSGGADSGGADATGGGDAGGSGGGGAEPITGWPEGNEYSWDGSWTPTSGQFPLAGLLDETYPELPPGDWDWGDEPNQSNWSNFSGNVGQFEPLLDSAGNQYGWELIGNEASVEYTGGAMYFEGSAGADIMNLGPAGSIHSLDFLLGDGPDVLVFNASWSTNIATGSSSSGAEHDNDLVVAGCDVNQDDSWDITTTTIHTGPGADWVFIRDLDRAAIDLGNGDGSDGSGGTVLHRTDTVDPNDGDDLVVIRGNSHDFRVFGGRGNDTIVWYVDDNIQSTAWLGPNFFGEGGWGDAIWADPESVDRLVLAVPTTTVVRTGGTEDPGTLSVIGLDDAPLEGDAPTENDPRAYYCLHCGQASDGRYPLVIEYRDAEGTINTGYTNLTSIEEVQVGVGDGAEVYRVDGINGELVLDESLTPTVPPSWPDSYCQ
ncbi:MAG: hypothetical protein P8099_20495, partial [Gemmatimonadota bacterium]